MGLFRRKGKEPVFQDREDLSQDLSPRFSWQDIPHTLDLGWYFSESKEEFQMAKIKEEDRACHLYVIGATGTGKTKFLEFLILQDIQKGNGFGVIDPHGDLIEDIKGFLACESSFKGEEILERVVLIDPTDPEFSPIFNPLETLSGVSAPEQAQELLSAFKKVWQDSWGVRMEDLLRNSLIALAEAGMTLTDLPHFLTWQEFREKVLEKVSHPLAKEYFQRFDKLTPRSQLTQIEPVMNKIDALLSDERIRQIFSLPESTFNLREIMDEGKILLVKLAKGKLKDSADLLGSLLLAKLQMAAFSRSELSPKERRPFYLYIDEFQNFATSSFAILLSEARKYGLSLTMAHQTLEQIPSELRSIILGNAGIQVYFRLSRKDAQVLAKEAFEYSGYKVKEISLQGHRYWSLGEEWELKIAELQNLPPRFCYVKHKIEGGIIPIQTVEIEPPWEVLGIGEKEYLKFLEELPFGRKWLLKREEIAKLSREREREFQKEIHKREEIRAPKEKLQSPKVKEPLKEKAEVKEEIFLPPLESLLSSQAFKERESKLSEHRYLQELFKRFAKEQGYRAKVEEPLPDGKRIDLVFELGGKRIACEISLSSPPEQELSRLKKSLEAGYDRVILCSPEERKLERIKNFISSNLTDSEKEKVLFLQPEECLDYLEREALALKTQERRVRGYKVKVGYLQVAQEERKLKREVITQVVLKALQRMKRES